MPATISDPPPGLRARSKRECAAWALAAVLAVLLWQTMTVHFNFGGNWTALFLTGDRLPIPPALGVWTYEFKNDGGYDGQFYRYVAHDPLFRKGFQNYCDKATIRYARILVPGLAWLLAAGRESWIDAAYNAVILGFVFAGAWWFSRYAAAHGRHPAWGLIFAVLPASIISAERMTVDVALAALCAGAAWYALQDEPRRLFVVAMLAPLARDTGLLVPAACCAYALMQRKWRRAAAFVAAPIPALLWIGYVFHHLPRGGPLGVAMGAMNSRHKAGLFHSWLFIHPVYGAFQALTRVQNYPLSPMANRIAQSSDIVAILGILLAMGLALWQWRRAPARFESWGALLFIVVAAMVSTPVYWRDINGYARVLTPLLMLVGMRSLSGNPLWVLAPCAMVDLRLAVQFGNEAGRILRGLFGG